MPLFVLPRQVAAFLFSLGLNFLKGEDLTYAFR